MGAKEKNRGGKEMRSLESRHVFNRMFRKASPKRGQLHPGGVVASGRGHSQCRNGTCQGPGVRVCLARLRASEEPNGVEAE